MTHYKTSVNRVFTMLLHHVHFLKYIYSYVNFYCSKVKWFWVIKHDIVWNKYLPHPLHKKMRFSIKDFFSKCVQIRRKLDHPPFLRLSTETRLFFLNVSPSIFYRHGEIKRIFHLFLRAFSCHRISQTWECTFKKDFVILCRRYVISFIYKKLFRT